MAKVNVQLFAILAIALGGALATKPLAKNPWIIAHRGLSGKYPEHTLEGYQAAIDAGADFIECDITVTKDRQLICRHEPLLSGTTDASLKFPSKNTSYTIDGVVFTGVFSTDLTLAEIKTLRAVQANPLRDPRYNGKFEVPTFEEYMDLALSQDRVVGIYPETKHPTWTNSRPFMLGTTMEDLMLTLLTKKGYKGALFSDAWNAQPCFIQSFETNNLKYLKTKTDLPLVQLLSGYGAVIPDTGKPVTEAVTDAGLDEIATYAAGVGPFKEVLRNISTVGKPANWLGASTGVVAKIHARGMQVHPYTFRNEDVYLADLYATDPYVEYDQYFRVEKIDGCFTDFTPTLRQFFRRAKALPKTNPIFIPYAPLEKAPLTTTRPYVIAHRGASGALPVETTEAYKVAIAEGADFIECDVVVTKDLKLVCRHEPNLSLTTDASAKFPALIRNYTIDGFESYGVHSTDLTLAQIRTLTTFQERLYRNQGFNYQFPMITFQEYIDIAQSADRVVGIYPETKHPTWHNNLPILKNAGKTFEGLLLAVLKRNGYGGALYSESWKKNPVFIQSFEVGNLKFLKKITDIPLIQLLDDITPDTGLTNLEMTTDAMLDEMAKYATGVGPWKDYIVHTNADNSLAKSTGLVQRIQARGMEVHPYTFRNEAQFLAWPYLASARFEYDLFFKKEGLDGCFTDFAGTLNDYFVTEAAYGTEWPQLKLGAVPC